MTFIEIAIKDLSKHATTNEESLLIIYDIRKII